MPRPCPIHIPAKDFSLILLAFLLPFSIYLLLLGIINRRPHPVVMPGTWDFAGLLFAASGFLLVTGPAVITSGSESWRMFWLFGSKAGIPAVEESAARIWGLLATLYFGIVVGGAIYLLRQRRGLTAIYNIRPEAFEKVLAQVFATLNLNPLRSGNLFVFGTGNAYPAPRRQSRAIQAPHHIPGSAEILTNPDAATEEQELFNETAVLEMDPFGALRHVTLRWEPASTMLRHEVETELSRVLSRTPTSPGPVGDWLVLIAMGLIGFNLLTTFLGLALSHFVRR
jgi:hypothetical protein